MAFRELAQRARDLVSRTLQELDEPEVERLLVAGAVVAREGNHYRIEAGEESWDEIEASARRRAGTCDCGSSLSLFAGRPRCRSCGREYRL